jgi:hypothetical protein
MKNTIVGSLTILAGILLPGESRAALIFTPNTPVASVDFTGLDAGDPITDLSGWSSDTPSDVVGAAPRQPLVNTHSTVLTTTNTSNRFASSPAQPSGLLSGGTVYFSAWINRAASASSGSRILLQDTGGTSLGGFTIEPGSPNRFGLTGTDGVYSYGSASALSSVWYEVALVIDLNPTDTSLSRGYLFFRDIALQPDFQIVAGLENGILMGYTSSLDATDFSKWSVQVRNGVQIDNLEVGTGILAIPEAGSLSLLFGAALALVAIHRLRFRHVATAVSH